MIDRRVPPLILVLIASAPALGRAEGDNPQRPNIVFLLSDDQRPDTIGALGNPRIRTPRLDRLVKRGTAFTRAVSPYPLCVPSRAEILTGCSGFRNGVLPPFGNRLDPELTTWPEALRGAGYQTWYVGKWHTSGKPTDHGYDKSLGLFASGGSAPPNQVDAKGREVTGYRGWVFQDDDGREFPERGVGLTPDISVRFADAAVALIEDRTDRPFFLHVNFTAPHDPLLVPTGSEGAYDPASIPLPPNFLPRHPFDHGNFDGRDERLWSWPRTDREVREDLALYYALISDLDAQVGRILDALERAGLVERTIVVFASDHGLAIGSHGLRGKQNMYEHTIGVPLILAGPGIPAGKRLDAQVYLREIYPTTCELVGVDVPESVEGRSFASLLRGEAQPDREYAFGYFADSQRMIRDDRWKLVRYPKVGREQLFDLARDPAELHDLSVEPGLEGVRERLRAALDAWRERVSDPIH